MAMVLPLMLSMRPNFTHVNFGWKVLATAHGVSNHDESNVAVRNAVDRLALDIYVMPARAANHLRFVAVRQDDALAEPLLAELAVEYATRYGTTEERVDAWLRGYPADEFEPPHGGMLIGVLDGRPVTGGAFRRFGVADGAETAELKRIWTDRRHRRRGFGRALLTELENAITAARYRRVYLTTGDRQPEAEGLYLATGYRRLAEPLPSEGEVYPVAFAKDLP
jgi:GNAT superfamily N-acetyltransferase